MRHCFFVTQPTTGPPHPPVEAKAGPSGEDVSKGVSAFLSGVLDQLSVTLWLPARFLVGNAAVLLVLQGQETSFSFNGAIKTLIQMEWGAIVVLVMSVIIAAVVIQAFAFEGLRFWEGYLRSRMLNRWARLRIARFSKRRAHLVAQCEKLATIAFDGARGQGLDAPDIIAAQVATFNAL